MFTLITKLKQFSLVKPLTDLRNRLSFRTIRGSSKTYLSERGWRRISAFPNHEYQGCYRTRYGSWGGKLVAGANPRYYLYKPPEALKLKHSHSACFSSQGNGWYSVHFRKIPKDLD